MNKISVSIGFHCDYPSLCRSPEDTYNKMYKKIASFLYANQQYPLTLYFSGQQLEWFEKSRREFLDILKELTERKQLELLGGGYYNPVFPFLLPVDRVGQVEFLTTAIRKTASKRPRGAWLAGSAWDSSLISTLNTCGMEFVLLDCQYTNSGYRPLIVEDMGKTLFVLPYDMDLVSNISCSPEEFCDKIIRQAKNIENAYVCCFFDVEKILKQNDPNWIYRLYELLEQNPAIELTLPLRYVKSVCRFKKTYLASGASPAILQRFSGGTFAHKNSVRNYLLEFPEALQLYSKMMYTSLLVNQCRGDRVRKKAAREELWQGQNCNSYWFLGSDGVTNQRIRQQSYRHLLNAEKMVRSAGSFVSSAVSFDFDMDGSAEYLFQFDSYNAVITPVGGMIQEFDSMIGLRNYADTMRRVKEYDIVSDTYPRKIFVDHFVSTTDLNKLKAGILDTDTVFPRLRYQETGFDRIKRELQFKVSGKYKNQSITLKKKYIATVSGIQVQYILKNESANDLTGCLAVECNLAFQGVDSDQQKIEAVIDSSLHEINPAEPSCFLCGAAYIELTDLCEPVSFSYETNENSGVFTYPLAITRFVNGVLEERYQATTCTFFWNVEIPPGREIEKMLLMNIKTKRKTK